MIASTATETRASTAENPRSPSRFMGIRLRMEVSPSRLQIGADQDVAWNAVVGKRNRHVDALHSGKRRVVGDRIGAGVYAEQRVRGIGMSSRDEIGIG